MAPLTRRERFAVSAWVLISIVAWNGVYDLFLLARTRLYLYQQALHLSGRSPAVSLSDAMAAGVRDAAWTATLCASLLLLASMLTLRRVRALRTEDC
jgi:hypothetical protein